MTSIIFWLLGALAVFAAVLAVTRRNPIYAALFMLVSLGSVSVLFLLLHAPFIAAMQLILYAGAIVVLFVFVIMLLSLKPEELGEEPPLVAQSTAAVAALAVFVLLALPGFKDEGLIRRTDGGRFRPVPAKVDMKDLLSVVAQRHGLRAEELRGPVSGDESRDKRRSLAQFDAAWLGLELGQSAGLVAHAMQLPVATITQRAASVGRQIEGSESLATSRRRRLEALGLRVRKKSQSFGSVEYFVGVLYTKYVVVFELVSVLIFAALVAVVVLARRKGFMGMASDEAREGAQLL